VAKSAVSRCRYATNRQETIMAARPRAVATIKIDEPHVRVTEFRFAPGAETGWHRHEYDYVVVPLLDGKLQLEEPGGTSRVAELHVHQPYTRLAGVEHNVINANSFEYAFLEVEHLR
jgi:quercetin dioxygenase-like cupin family protein